ncbi:MAG: hypothetical protein WD512_08040, partial [Candidatus Paceibacterota bacterium]
MKSKVALYFVYFLFMMQKSITQNHAFYSPSKDRLHGAYLYRIFDSVGTNSNNGTKVKNSKLVRITNIRNSNTRIYGDEIY